MLETPTPEADRVPLLTARTLRRIRARCIARTCRRRRNYPEFNPRDEMYFFLGVSTVLSCFRDREAEALSGEWPAYLMPQPAACEPSPAGQAAAARYTQRAAIDDAVKKAIVAGFQFDAKSRAK